MREILFRGKRIDNGEWIEGSLWIIDKFYILTTANCVGFEVDPKSVGQYIGENDANGTKIFEDDISGKVFKYVAPLQYVERYDKPGEYEPYVMQFVRALEIEIRKHSNKVNSAMQKHIGKYQKK